MFNKRIRFVAILGISFLLGAVVFFYGSFPGFVQNSTYKNISELQSNTLSGNNTSDEQITLLKKQRSAAVENLTLLNTRIGTDADRARSILRRLMVSPSRQQAIINDFALVAPRSYYNDHEAQVLGKALFSISEIRNLINSINTTVNDRNLLEESIKDYDTLLSTIKVTPPVAVDPVVATPPVVVDPVVATPPVVVDPVVATPPVVVDPVVATPPVVVDPVVATPPVVTGNLTINSPKDCWFAHISDTMTLRQFLTYQSNPANSSGLAYLDEIFLYSSTPPVINEKPTNILSYENPRWTSGESGVTVRVNKQLTNYFKLRTYSTIERTWNIPDNNDFKSYGCFPIGQMPTTW